MKKILFCISIVALILCLAIGTYAADTSSDVYVTASTGGETVKITPTKNIFYLPSSVDITKLELVSEGGDIAYENEDKSFCGTVSKGQTIDLSKASSTDERGAKCYKLKLTAGGKSVSYTFYADSSVASVFISTSQGISYIERNKENRDKESKILIISENGNIEYSDISANTESEIKGRGNLILQKALPDKARSENRHSRYGQIKDLDIACQLHRPIRASQCSCIHAR